MQKFLLTKELGRLAKWLRILGYDARTERSDNRSFIMIEALREERVLLTRNLRFGTRHGGTIIFIKQEMLADQLKDFLNALHLKVEPERLFSRCIVCNEALDPVEKSSLRDKVPAYVYETQEEFRQCRRCLRVYWKGTHWGNVAEILSKLER